METLKLEGTDAQKERSRKLLRRGSFASVDDLVAKVRDFITYYNRTMAKPFTWTYQGTALAT